MSTVSLKDQKHANTDYPIHELIRQRWSPRAYDDRPVDRELLRQLFDAARWAPSSFNEQPWRFFVATQKNPEEFDRLSEILMSGNSWAKEAPVLGLTVVKNRFSKNDKENRVARHDLGQAVSYLTIEAMRHELYVHQMAGIHLDKARELLNIPEGFDPVTMFTIGYIGEPDQLPENLQTSERAERSRKEIDEVLFMGDWDHRQPL